MHKKLQFIVRLSKSSVIAPASSRSESGEFRNTHDIVGMCDLLMESPYLTDDEAAAYVRLSPSRFRFCVSKGELSTPFRRGSRGARLWTSEILDQWLSGCGRVEDEQTRMCASGKEVKEDGARQGSSGKRNQETDGRKMGGSRLGDRSEDGQAEVAKTTHRRDAHRRQGSQDRAASRHPARKHTASSVQAAARELRQVVAEVQGIAGTEINSY